MQSFSMLNPGNEIKENWYLWKDSEHSPFFNMATDECLLENSEGLGIPLLRIYGWDRPSVSIGYTQDYNAAPHREYTVVRRPTGGGIVYHDNDLTYTIAVPPSHRILSLDRIESYHVFHRAVLRALAAFGLRGILSDTPSPPVDRASMKCFITPTRYDVLCGNEKYAGSAQRRTRNGILHQGSILLDAADGDRSMLTEKLADAFAEEFAVVFVPFSPDAAFIGKIMALEKEKFSRPEWNISKNC